MDWEAFYSRFRQPDFVPGYEIQNRLGGGAFGEVYKARKASIGKAYAIKFLKIDDEAQRDAALRELEQVRHFAAIDHPNLVTIEDLGTAVGVPYLIMGYAGEETLAKLLKRGPVEPGAALAYFVQTCRGVLALHDRRLVHFDLKPSNVFIKGDVARVGDYGLSKMLVEGRMTLSFGRGTPQYMAPEMLKNRADHRADIYSLGVMLYECIAGKAPFESEVPGTFAVRENDDPPAFADEFPPRVRAVVERCLRLDPADRYESVADLLAELGQAARVGESIRIELPIGVHAAPSRPAIASETPVTPSTPRIAPDASAIGADASSEARATAAELTRGAVEVARGVWDGLRNPGPRGRAPATRSSTTNGAATPSPVGSSARPATPTPELPRAVAIARDEALAARPSVAPSVTSSAASVGTIPVPPAVSGGVLAGFGAAIALSFEVLFSLVRGAGRGLSGRWNRTLGPRSEAPRRWSSLARVLRLVLFVLVLLSLGTLVSFAFFQLVGLRGNG